MRKQLFSKLIKTSNLLAAITAAVALPLISFHGSALADINNTRVDAAGTVELASSGWLSGGGVTIYSNGNSASNDAGANCVAVSGAPGDGHCSAGNVWSGEKWQCVEMVNRLYLTKGWTTGTWTGNGNTLINHVPDGLTEEGDGSISSLNPGDVITLDDGGDGHAGIINTVGSSIQIVNQNTTAVYSTASIPSGHGSLAAGNADLEMTGWAGYEIQAVIHHPSSTTTSAKSRPAVVTQSNGNVAIYAIAATGHLWQKYWTPTNGWSGWGDLSAPPSALTGTPGVVTAPSDGSTDIYAATANGHIWEKYWNPTNGWSGWGDKGTVSGGFTNSPTVLGSADTGISIYAITGAGHMWQKYWTPTNGWSGWGDKGTAGGGLTGTPGMVVAPSDGSTDAYATAANNHIWEIYWTPTNGWSGWGDKGTVPGGFSASPTVTGSGDTGIGIYAISGGDHMWQRYWTPTNGWSGWGDQGTAGNGLAGMPGIVVAPSDGTTDVYATTNNGHVWEKYWNPTNGWSGWGDKDSVPNGVASSPTVIGSGDTSISIYVVSGAGHIWQKYWTPTNGWSGWGDQGTAGGGF